MPCGQDGGFGADERLASQDGATETCRERWQHSAGATVLGARGGVDSSDRAAWRLKQRARCHEICGAETLGEAPIDRCQDFTRIARAALRLPEPRQARRTAELPRQRPMSASAVERAL